jgi:hypothetical protein
MQGLGAGRSFVTTGPMLMIEVNGHPPGSIIWAESYQKAAKVFGRATLFLQLVLHLLLGQSRCGKARASRPRTGRPPHVVHLDASQSRMLALRRVDDAGALGRTNGQYGREHHCEQRTRSKFPSHYLSPNFTEHGTGQ